MNASGSYLLQKIANKISTPASTETPAPTINKITFSPEKQAKSFWAQFTQSMNRRKRMMF